MNRVVCQILQLPLPWGQALSRSETMPLLSGFSLPRCFSEKRCESGSARREVVPIERQEGGLQKLFLSCEDSPASTWKRFQACFCHRSVP